jgi:hypothetical protein
MLFRLEVFTYTAWEMAMTSNDVSSEKQIENSKTSEGSYLDLQL